MRKRLVEEIGKYGLSEDLADRLIFHGETAVLKWLVGKVIEKDVPLEPQIRARAAEFGRTTNQIRFAYFQPLRLRLSDIQDTQEYEALMTVLCERYDSREFWDELLPYAYLQTKKIAAELMFESGETDVSHVMDVLNMKNGLAYNVRKDFINKKGNDYGK